MRFAILRIEQDRVHGHAAGAGLPELALGAAQSGKFLPGFAAVRRLENRRVFRAGVDRVRIGERRFEMPDALEFPRMLRAVVPLVRARPRLRRRTCCSRLWACRPGLSTPRAAARRVPGLAAVIRALDDLAEPTAGLRRVDAIRINGRAFEVIHLPARKMRPADFPVLALAIRRQDERALLWCRPDTRTLLISFSFLSMRSRAARTAFSIAPGVFLRCQLRLQRKRRR